MADDVGALPACSSEEDPSDSYPIEESNVTVSINQESDSLESKGKEEESVPAPCIETVCPENEECCEDSGRENLSDSKVIALESENSECDDRRMSSVSSSSEVEQIVTNQSSDNEIHQQCQPLPLKETIQNINEAEESISYDKELLPECQPSEESVNKVEAMEELISRDEDPLLKCQPLEGTLNKIEAMEESVCCNKEPLLKTQPLEEDIKKMEESEDSISLDKDSLLKSQPLDETINKIESEEESICSDKESLQTCQTLEETNEKIEPAEESISFDKEPLLKVLPLEETVKKPEAEEESICSEKESLVKCQPIEEPMKNPEPMEESICSEKESLLKLNSSSTSNALSSNKETHFLRRILYSGYKKKSSNLNISKSDKKLIPRNNPFNPSWKRNESKLIKSISDCEKNVIDPTSNADGTGLSIQDCTHYLGLQPSINFRCNHCGISGFESIHLLNLHQVECRKITGHSTSTNIKITRKVYLCSACGTYYESWHLFYHMRKVHDKFMCLYCLGMFTFSDKLCEHLMVKHQVNFINFPDFESFKKCNLSSYLFLCLDCDNVMSDSENFKHICSPHKIVSKFMPTKPAHGISVPCVGTVTVVNTTPKKGIPNTNNISKSNCTDDFIGDPSNFCHVDMNSPIKENVPEVQQPPEEVKQPPPKIQTVKSEFPKIDLQPSRNMNSESSPNENVFDSIGSIEEDSNQSGSIKNENNKPSENKNSVKKSFKRRKMNSNRHTKKAKIDPEQQKSALEKLTETIDAVAKNYQIKEPSSPTPPASDSHDSNGIIDEPVASNPEEMQIDSKQSVEDDKKMEDIDLQHTAENPKEDPSTNGVAEKPLIWKQVPDKNTSKFKLHTDLESDEESDDSNKLSMAIDDTPAHSDNDSKPTKLTIKGIFNTSDESSQGKDFLDNISSAGREDFPAVKSKQNEIALAGEDIPAMALTLDDKVQNVKVQQILKECVRTSCMSCNYCRRAVKIAVNGKYLALHLLSEHRYTPTKNDSPEDVINKLKSSLEELSNVYFNTESYDSSDRSIHIPYDKDNTFDCFQCSYVTYSHKDLYIHKRKSHTKSLLLCIMCKINFYSYSELLCHLCPGHYDSDLQPNNVDIHFRCCFCQLNTIPSAFRLMVHLRKCHHTCDICLEICSDQQKLSTHMWKHKLNHLCYRCGIAYASKLDITKHLFWKHGTESVLCKKCLQKKWPHVYHFCIPPTSFLCEECNSSFTKAVALKVHKRIHANDFSYHCSQCEKKFVSKKLLQKHEDQHKNPEDTAEQEEKGKEEIIDVTGESTGNTDGGGEIQQDPIDYQKESDKENESSKHHKKHKKDKKGKQVIDVYDLPPLNLSSDSDSSDDESSSKNALNDVEKDDNDDESNNLCGSGSVKESTESENVVVDSDISNNPVNNTPSNEYDALPSNTVASQLSEEADKTCSQEKSENSLDDNNSTEAVTLLNNDDIKVPEEPRQNTSIWENFYKINSTNKNLPYPLCAMRTEDAYKIIMGDHDYCLQMKISDPIIKEDIPTQSNLEENKTDCSNSTMKAELNETTASDSSPTKKKQKSPKKKTTNNSSSSSDTSSDSDSSSCSCGDNCSCSSSSSDSSSSSSSDSDSSASDTPNKQRSDKKKRRKEKKLKIVKNVSVVDQNGENKTIVESSTPLVPEEPTIRESDLDTDESSTDEEFYDRQPQKITNQLLAEKRNQLMLLASVAPVHGEGLAHELTKSSTFNDSFNDESNTMPPNSDPANQSAKKVSKARRRKKFLINNRKRVNNKSYPFNNVPQSIDNSHKTSKPFNILKLKEPKRPEKQIFDVPTPPCIIRSQLPSEINSAAALESENVRSSKRKRVPNKFYGYSSGEEEERSQPKWRKPEILTPPPPPSPVSTPKFVHSTPQTPKIQLSLPKQIIRKSQNESPKVRHYLSGNDSTDSSSDNDKRLSHISKPPAITAPPPTPPPSLPPPPPPPPLPTAQSKQDKNLYCYCRCPYDEVSEMIACDDENCKIEWFHFECVGISVPPKGQWFCPQCSKKRGILP